MKQANLLHDHDDVRDLRDVTGQLVIKSLLLHYRCVSFQCVMLVTLNWLVNNNVHDFHLHWRHVDETADILASD